MQPQLSPSQRLQLKSIMVRLQTGLIRAHPVRRPRLRSQQQKQQLQLLLPQGLLMMKARARCLHPLRSALTGASVVAELLWSLWLCQA